jgi:2,3-bisphosphoglycerate-independent phosphoglycerate mutase
MTTSDPSLDLPVAFPSVSYPNILAQVLARAGCKQFRCAETEKFAQVTASFNAGRPEPFDGEDRRVVVSARGVPSHDQKPEIAADTVADATQEAIRSGKYDFVLVNFANPDVFGHTGILESAVRAVEAVDTALGKIVEAVRAVGGALVVTASHGNCEQMRDDSGQPHTGHTTNPVPFLYMNEADPHARIREGGRLWDVAPTLLDLMGLPQPAEMTGQSLLVR